jgi:hypothetical protein
MLFICTGALAKKRPLIFGFELGSLIWSVYDIDLITLFFYVLWLRNTLHLYWIPWQIQ